MDGTEITYEGFDASLVDELEVHARDIMATQEQVRRIAAEGVLAIGKRLTAVQSLLSNHKNGTFGKWVEERLGMSRKSAERAIAAFTRFGYCDNLSQYFDASSLYLLSAESTPEHVRLAAIASAAHGEQVTHKKAQELLREALGGPADDKPWTVKVALDKTDEALQRIEQRWPERSRKAFGNFLIERGNDILKYGELPK